MVWKTAFLTPEKVGVDSTGDAGTFTKLILFGTQLRMESRK
jgi:hypothetical protein